VAQELEEIEQLTKYLNMEQLFGLNSKTADIRLLSSASKLEVQMRIIEFIDVKEPLKAVEFSSLELQQLAEQHRNQFEQLVLLNSSIVASLNQRVRAIDSRIAELERK
jgi:molybdenum cofactor biosynthesis enzyme MoaA